MNVQNLEGTLNVRTKEVTLVKGSIRSGKSHTSHLLFKDAVDKGESVLLIDGLNSRQHIQVNRTTLVRDLASATIGQKYDRIIYVNNGENDFQVVSTESDCTYRQVSVGAVG